MSQLHNDVPEQKITFLHESIQMAVYDSSVRIFDKFLETQTLPMIFCHLDDDTPSQIYTFKVIPDVFKIRSVVKAYELWPHDRNHFQRFLYHQTFKSRPSVTLKKEDFDPNNLMHRYLSKHFCFYSYINKFDMKLVEL